jgi:hypothetical protein
VQPSRLVAMEVMEMILEDSANSLRARNNQAKETQNSVEIYCSIVHLSKKNSEYRKT